MRFIVIEFPSCDKTTFTSYEDAKRYVEVNQKRLPSVLFKIVVGEDELR